MKVRVSNLIHNDQRLPYIKLFRFIGGIGLKEAKDISDAQIKMGETSVEIESRRPINVIQDSIKNDSWMHKDVVVEYVNPVPAVEEIKSEGTQLFNVPNDTEGLKFLNLCKKYMNKNRFGAFKKRGRGKNRPKNQVSNDLRESDSEWFAVYPEESKLFRNKKHKDVMAKWQCEMDSRKNEEEKLRKRIRQEIAMEQLQSGIVLPEVIELVRQQVRKEVMEEVGQKLRVRQVRLDLGDDVMIELSPTT